jgi:hypothetical protein
LWSWHKCFSFRPHTLLLQVNLSSSSAWAELASPFRPQALSSHVAIFVLVFLDHVVLSVDSIEVAWELLNGLLKYVFRLPQPFSIFLTPCKLRNFLFANTAMKCTQEDSTSDGQARPFVRPFLKDERSQKLKPSHRLVSEIKDLDVEHN